MKIIIDIPEEIVKAIQNGEDYRYDIHTAIAQGISVSTEGDLISRSALKEAIKECMVVWDEHSDYGTGRLRSYEWVLGLIDNAPTVDTDLSKYSDKLWKRAYERGKNERPHGKWITTWDRYIFQCSCCHGKGVKYNFCPECGADMRGEE